MGVYGRWKIQLISAHLALMLHASAVGQQNLVESDYPDNSGVLEAPSVKIYGQIIPKDNNDDFAQLVDAWWKVLAWTLAALTLACLGCYLTKCCYLCWDCCTDPFWGCCPRRRSCKNCLLIKCYKGPKDKGTYDLCVQDVEANFNEDALNFELSEYDFTLRTVESMEVDGMLSKVTNTTDIELTPIRGQGQILEKGVVTSTPRRKIFRETGTTESKHETPSFPEKNGRDGSKNWSGPKKIRHSESTGLFLELSGEAESMPQFNNTHYFNILNLFGVGCSNYKVSVAEQNNKKCVTSRNGNANNNNTNGSDGSTQNSNHLNNDGSTVAMATDDDDDNNQSFEKFFVNNDDFLLSSSFSNMFKRNGLHIEEGRVGRYQLLPEAREELLPPATFLRKVKRQNSSAGMNRRSQSMEMFRLTNQCSVADDLLVVHHNGCIPPAARKTCSSVDGLSSTTNINDGRNIRAKSRRPSGEKIDDSGVIYEDRNHSRSHSEGSRIGHRRTPSMDGVPTIQNGNPIMSGRRRDHLLPPKVPDGASKKRQRKAKLADANMESCILFGKETTL